MMQKKCATSLLHEFDNLTLYLDYAMAILSFAVAGLGMLGDDVQKKALVAFALMCWSRRAWPHYPLMSLSLHTLGHLVIVLNLIKKTCVTSELHVLRH